MKIITKAHTDETRRLRLLIELFSLDDHDTLKRIDKYSCGRRQEVTYCAGLRLFKVLFRFLSPFCVAFGCDRKKHAGLDLRTFFRYLPLVVSSDCDWHNELLFVFLQHDHVFVSFKAVQNPAIEYSGANNERISAENRVRVTLVCSGIMVEAERGFRVDKFYQEGLPLLQEAQRHRGGKLPIAAFRN